MSDDPNSVADALERRCVYGGPAGKCGDCLKCTAARLLRESAGTADRLADAELIAAAPTLITDLLAEVNRLNGNDDGRCLEDHERSRCTAGHVRQIIEEAEQLAAERDAAVARADELLAMIDRAVDLDRLRAAAADRGTDR